MERAARNPGHAIDQERCAVDALRRRRCAGPPGFCRLAAVSSRKGVSKSTRFRLIVGGETGVKEIERLIQKRELDKEILGRARGGGRKRGGRQ